jgi:hypothetical protein
VLSRKIKNLKRLHPTTAMRAKNIEEHKRAVPVTTLFVPTASPIKNKAGRNEEIAAKKRRIQRSLYDSLYNMGKKLISIKVFT